MVKHASIILFLCFLHCALLKAAPGNAGMLHFDIDNGLPSNNVYSLIQDKLGYLWFATDNGLVKYNGYSFKTFNTSNGLPSNDVYQLYEDKRGRIWLNSMSYQFGYMQNDKYHEISLRTHDRILKACNFCDYGQYLFLIYLEYNYFRLAVIKDDLVSVFPLCPSAEIATETPTGNLAISYAMLNRDCKMYFAGTDSALYRYDLVHTDRRFTRFCDNTFSELALSGGTINGENDNIYQYAIRGKELLIFNPNSCFRKRLFFDRSPGEYIYTIVTSKETHAKDRTTGVLTNSFLYKVDSNANVLSRLRIDSFIKTNAQLAFIFNDNNGNEWFTTNSDGAWCKLKKYYSFDGDPALEPVRNSKFVGASVDGSMFWWNKKGSLVHKLSSGGSLEKLDLPLKTTLKCVADYNDSAMFLVLSTGIYKYNKVTGRIHDIIQEKKHVVINFSDRRHTVTKDTSETIFMGNQFGILSYSKDEFFTVGWNGFHIFKQYPDSLICNVITNERFTNIIFDSVWNYCMAYNHQKILLFDPLTEKYLVLPTAYLKSLGINNIQNIEIDRYHNVYIKNNDRIIIYNPERNCLKDLSLNFNLADAIFHVCGEQLVIAGKFGVAVANITGPLSITLRHIAPNIAYYKRVEDFVINAKGTILLNTDQEFYRFQLKDLDSNNDFIGPADPRFFNLVLKSPGERKLERNDTVRLDEHVERIDLDAINYLGKGTPGFKYSIAGKSGDWQHSDGEIFVGNLSPGRYYRFTCIVSDDIWKGNPVFFYVYRSPYWWQTTFWQVIFWISGGVVIVIMLLLAVFITRAVVAKGNEKRRALTDLELRAIYAQINPHFIFNTLNAAQFFINKKRFDDAYIHVSKFSRLLRAYLKSSQDRYITLDEEVQMLKNYIELQQTRFEEKFEYRLEIENKIPANSIKIPSLLLQPLVENAINHGLFHKESGGLLILKFLQGAKNDELVCIIEDNGIGRKQAEILKKESSASRDSYGTKLTQQLINIYREYEKMDIYLEYIDKTEPETGTIVKLTIKNVKYVA